MPEQSELSVSDWIANLRAGDPAAVQPIWERYFDRLVQTARARLKPRGYVDGEDVALSAFDSFCEAVKDGRFPRLEDRNDLWRLLIFITAQKISKLITYERAQIRGGGLEPVGGSAIATVIGNEPAPEFVVEVAEEFRLLLQSLREDSLRKIALWKMEGYTNEEIAARLDCSLKTVSNKLKLIRMRLERRSRAS